MCDLPINRQADGWLDEQMDRLAWKGMTWLAYEKERYLSIVDPLSKNKMRM